MHPFDARRCASAARDARTVAITSTSGQTVLHLSASTGQPKLSKYLIEKGANPLTKDADGKIPLDYAVQNQHPVTTKLLKGYSEKK